MRNAGESLVGAMSYLTRILREAIAAIFYYCGLSFLLLLRLRRGRVAIIYYHDPKPEIFAHHLRALSGKFAFTSLAAISEGDWPQKHELSRIVVAFDDGHAGNYLLAPVLRLYKIKATIYICTGIVATRRRYWWQAVASAAKCHELKWLPDVERRRRLREAYNFTQEKEWPGRRSALSRDEIKDMTDCVTFGAHTRFHPILPCCDDRTCRVEVSDSRQETEALSGEPCEHFAFPNGMYTEREIKFAKQGGYKTARGTEWGWMSSGDRSFVLKGIRIPDDATVPMLMGQLWGLGRMLNLISTKKRRLFRVSKTALLGIKSFLHGR